MELQIASEGRPSLKSNSSFELEYNEMMANAQAARKDIVLKELQSGSGSLSDELEKQMREEEAPPHLCLCRSLGSCQQLSCECFFSKRLCSLLDCCPECVKLNYGEQPRARASTCSQPEKAGQEEKSEGRKSLQSNDSGMEEEFRPRLFLFQPMEEPVQ